MAQFRHLIAESHGAGIAVWQTTRSRTVTATPGNPEVRSPCFSSSKQVALWPLFHCVLSKRPVLHEPNRRSGAQRRMTTTAVVKDFNVLEQISGRFVTRAPAFALDVAESRHRTKVHRVPPGAPPAQRS